MADIPVDHAMVLAAVLLALGVTGAMVRRNLVFILMSIEVMINACGLAFVVAGAHWGQADGQIMFLLSITVAGAAAAVGLALLLRMYHTLGTLDMDAAREMRG